MNTWNNTINAHWEALKKIIREDMFASMLQWYSPHGMSSSIENLKATTGGKMLYLEPQVVALIIFSPEDSQDSCIP